MKIPSSEHVIPMFCKIRASDKDLPVLLGSKNPDKLAITYLVNVSGSFAAVKVLNGF